MTDSLVVLMEDQIAGTLVRAPGGRLTFTYSEEYREREGVQPRRRTGEDRPALSRRPVGRPVRRRRNDPHPQAGSHRAR